MCIIEWLASRLYFARALAVRSPVLSNRTDRRRSIWALIVRLEGVTSSSSVSAIFVVPWSTGSGGGRWMVQFNWLLRVDASTCALYG